MKKNILIYYDLIIGLKTTQEVASFTQEIEILIELTSSGKDIETALSNISTETAKKIRKTLTKGNLRLEKREEIAIFFETLKKLIKKFRAIKLILAFDPSAKTIERLHNYITDILGIGYILDIEVSENLLAGAAVIVDGKYKDYSLNKAIEDAFENKKEEVLRLMQ